MVNKKNRAKQFYSNLLFIYISLLLIFFIAYCFSIMFSSYKLEKEYYAFETLKLEQEVNELTNSYFENSEKIINRVNYSVSFMDPYMKLLSDSPLSATDRSTVVIELRNAYAWSGLKDVEDILLFMDNKEIALSAAGVVNLSSPFSHMAFPTTHLEINSITGLLGVESPKFTFSDENLMFVHGFRYQGGNDRGVILISFDKNRVKARFDSLLKDHSYGVYYNGVMLFSSSSFVDNDETAVLQNTIAPRAQIKINFSPFRWNGPALGQILSVLAGFVLFIVILFIFIHSRKKYHTSISKIRNLIPVKESLEDDEIDTLVHDLEGMVVDLNTYKDNFDQAIPYIQHGFFASDYGSESDNRYMSKYMGFVKPYYLVVAVNIDSLVREDLERVAKQAKEVLTDEKTIVSFHLFDEQTVFFFFNTDSKIDEREKSKQLYLLLKAILSTDVKITVGSDSVREDFDSFKTSCNKAFKALNMMVVLGKDDIYFSEEKEESEDKYYMIPALYLQISKCISEGSKEKLTSLFDRILKTNLMKYDLSAESVRSISDELYLTERKVYMNLGLEPRLGQIVRAGAYATIEEVIEFYTDRFNKLLEQYGNNTNNEETAYTRLIKYVDENFTNPELSLNMLSDMFSLSTKSIGNYFTQEFNHTYLDYVTHKRITHSLTLLSKLSKSIDDVAKECGYSSTLTYRRNFKEALGQTPGEYRKSINP